MKGIDSVLQGYAEGGGVNPFQEYASTQQSFNPFSYLTELSFQGRPEYVGRSPTSINTPGTSISGGSRNIYDNLETVKALQALKKAASDENVTAPAPEVGTGEGEVGGGNNRAGYSSTYSSPPGTGYNMPATVLGGLGTLAGIPGLGLVGSGIGIAAANDYLSKMGIPSGISIPSALGAGLSYGVFGQSIQSQVDRALKEAVRSGALNISDILEIQEAIRGPTISEQYANQVTSGGLTSGAAGTAAAQDLNTVGILGEVLAAIDAAEQSRSTRDIDAANAQFDAAPAQATGSSDTPSSSDSSPSSGDPTGGEGPAGLASGGYVPGKSGGMDDDVPAIIDGKQPARLSSGEFVFDAATVAAAGDGNNAAGAKKLDGLRKAIRKKAYGHEKQPPKNYNIGDLVRIYDRGR